MKISKLLWHFLIISQVQCVEQTAEKAFPIILQKESIECGPICLKMVAEHFGKKVELRKLCELSKMDSTGTSLFALSEAAKEIGLNSLAAKIEFDTLIKKGLPLPAMLHWNNNHFVVLYKYHKNFFWIADPAIGKVEYDKKEFCSHWLQSDISNRKEGVILLLEKTDKF
jgi:ATP-binding cassette, subfamily B, bacterial